MGRFRSTSSHPHGVFGSTYDIIDQRPRPPWLSHVVFDARFRSAVTPPDAHMGTQSHSEAALRGGPPIFNSEPKWRIRSWRSSCTLGDMVNTPSWPEERYRRSGLPPLEPCIKPKENPRCASVPAPAPQKRQAFIVIAAQLNEKEIVRINVSMNQC